MTQQTKGNVPEMIRRFLKPGQTAVDVGANIGRMTRIMAECVGPSGRVYAIEPTDQIRAIDATPPIIPVQVAAGERHGDCTLFQTITSACSRWHGDAPSGSFPMRTLDELIPDEVIDLVKIDTQGSESHILEGAKDMLARCPIWIIELWPWGLTTAKRCTTDVLWQLRSAGLVPRWSGGEEMETADAIENLRQQKHVNLYAIRP